VEWYLNDSGWTMGTNTPEHRRLCNQLRWIVDNNKVGYVPV
jgi:hypothetical protein